MRKRVFRGDRLRQIREKRGMTQDELGEQLGFGQSQMNKYETGKSEPTPEVITRLATELQVTADYLLGLVEKPDERLRERDLTPDEQRLLTAFRRGDLQQALRILAEKSLPEMEH